MDKKLKTVLLIAIAIFFATCDLLCQAYIGTGISNKGGNLSLGALVDNVDFSINYHHPFTMAENKTVTSFNVGYQLQVNGVLFITPTIGYGYCKWKDLSQYHAGGDIIEMSEFKPVIGLQTGIQKGAGSIFCYGNYVGGESWFGIGIRCFLSKL